MYYLVSHLFQVEKTLFRVHRHFFTRESIVFHDMLSIPSGSETTIEGLSDDNPIVLAGVKRVHFEWMLWMFYNELSHQLLDRSSFFFFVRSADQVIMVCQSTEVIRTTQPLPSNGNLSYPLLTNGSLRRCLLLRVRLMLPSRTCHPWTKLSCVEGMMFLGKFY